MRRFTVFMMGVVGLARGLSLVHKHKNVQVVTLKSTPANMSVYHDRIRKLDDAFKTMNLVIQDMMDDFVNTSGVLDAGLETLQEALDHAGNNSSGASLFTVSSSALTKAHDVISLAQESMTSALTKLDKFPESLKILDGIISKLEKGTANSSLIAARTAAFASRSEPCFKWCHDMDIANTSSWTSRCTFDDCTGCSECGSLSTPTAATTDETPCSIAADALTNANMQLALFGALFGIPDQLDIAQTAIGGALVTMGSLSSQLSQLPDFMTLAFQQVNGILTQLAALIGKLQAGVHTVQSAVALGTSVVDELDDFIPLAKCAGVCGEMPAFCEQVAA